MLCGKAGLAASLDGRLTRDVRDKNFDMMTFQDPMIDGQMDHSRLHGKTVLVTGGTGFIGGRLVEKLVLEHGARVRVLVRDFGRASRVARFPVEMLAGSTTDLAAVREAAKGCSVVFDCAYGNRGDAGEQWATNVGGAGTVADAVVAEGVSRLVHVSSLAVYGRTRDGVIDESEPRKKWHDAYSASKREAAKLLLDRARREGLPVVIIEPSVVYGPYSGWTTMPLDWLSKHRVVLLDDGAGLCNCVYVDDVVEALLLAAVREGVVGETFLVASHEEVSWKQFYGAYERMLGFSSTVAVPVSECVRRERWSRLAPRLARRALGKIQRQRMIRRKLLHSGFLKLPVLSRVRQSWLYEASAPLEKSIQWPHRTQIDLGVMRTRPSIQKARNRLGYEPRFSFASGMARTEAWAAWAGLLPADPCGETQDSLSQTDFK
jgi:nucleoside-diphosphate-sugar epimerase